MATYSLSGSGTHSLTTGTTGLQVTITTPSAIGGVGRSNPIAKYDQGLIRFSDGTSYWPPVAILGGPQFIPVPANATGIGYALLGGAVVSVVEVIGGTVFFSGGTPSLATLSDVLLASIADGQSIKWVASDGKWENYTPAGGAGGATASLLDFAPTADQIALTTLTVGSYTDVCADQTFTVTDATANIWILASGCAYSDSNTWTRIVVDSAGTPIIRFLGSDSAVYGNPFAGAMPICLGTLSAGAHTVKVQAATKTPGNRIRLQTTTTGRVEFIEIHVRQGG